MTKTINTFNTIAEVCQFIEKKCNAFAEVYESPFIASDGEISCNHLRRVHDNHLVSDLKPRPTFDYAPYSFYLGIRERGTESAESKEHILDRVIQLGDKLLCGISVKYGKDGVWVVTLKRV